MHIVIHCSKHLKYKKFQIYCDCRNYNFIINILAISCRLIIFSRCHLYLIAKFTIMILADEARSIYLYPVLHEFAKRCIRCNIPLTINSTPACIKDKVTTHSLHGFTNYIKAHYLQSYTDQCTIPNCRTCQYVQYDVNPLLRCQRSVSLHCLPCTIVDALWYLGACWSGARWSAKNSGAPARDASV